MSDAPGQQHLDLPLVTRNKADFKHVTGLRVVNPLLPNKLPELDTSKRMSTLTIQLPEFVAGVAGYHAWTFCHSFSTPCVRIQSSKSA